MKTSLIISLLVLVLLPNAYAVTLFESNWSTATGNSVEAFTDGNTWDTYYCQDAPRTLTSVAGASLDWTLTPNVLRIQQNATTCGMLEKRNAIPLSTTHWGRMYFRNDEFGSAHNHVMTYNALGAIQVAIWNRYAYQLQYADGFATFIRTYYTSAGTGTSYPTNYWTIQSRLSNGIWYRYEWEMEYVTPTTYRIWPRIYDMQGNLLFNASSYFQNDYPQSGPYSLTTWYAAGNTFGFSDVSLARHFGLGNEGPGGSTATGLYWYHAAVKLSTDGWIGGIGQTQQALGPNQPADHTTRVNSALSGSTITGNGAWGDGWTVQNFVDPQYNLTMRVTTNPTAPVSPTQVLEVEQTTASAAGGGPRIDRYFAAANDTYLSFWFRLTPGFDITNVPSHKIVIIEPNNIIMSLAHWCPDYNGGNCLTQSRQILLTVASLVPGTAEAGYLNTLNLPGVRTNTPITTGDWHRVEMRLQRRGVGQSIIEWWIDGVLQGQHTGLTIGNAQDGVPFDLLRIAPQASGLGTQAIQTQAIQYDHIYLSTGTGGTAPTDTTPPTATITAPTTAQILVAETTSTPLTVTTNEASTCRWSTTDIAYGSMTNTLAGTGTTSHSATLTGLTNGGSNTTYVRCSDTAGNSMATSVSRSFSVATPPRVVFFESNWSTATGTTRLATGDNGIWNQFYCDDATRALVQEVVPGAAYGWTLTPNILQMTMNGTNCALIQNQYSVPFGTDFYTRSYIQVLDANLSSTNHPYKTGWRGSNSIILWSLQNRNPNTRTYQPSVRMNNYGYTGTNGFNWDIGSFYNTRTESFDFFGPALGARRRPCPGSSTAALRSTGSAPPSTGIARGCRGSNQSVA